MRLRARPLHLLLLPTLLAAGLLLPACGGGDEEDAKALLEEAFGKPIKSADVSVDAKIEVEGVDQLKDPISLKLSGPYRNNGDRKLPGLDFKGNVSAAGQSFSFGFVSTGDNAFVNVQGTNYEVGERLVAQLNRQLARQRGENQRQSLSALGINPLDWIEDAEEEGDEKVAGADTTHIAGGIDVGKMLDDLNQAIEKAPRQAGAPTPPRLTDEQKDKIREVVKDPKIDVYVAKDDKTIRRLSGDLDFEVPEDDRKQVGGLEGGSVSFSVELANVGGDQRIKAPANARPLEELGSQLGGLGSGLAPSPGGGSSGGAAPGGGSSGGGGSGSSGGTSPDAESFERYSDCLKKAGSNDAKAIEKCAEILR